MQFTGILLYIDHGWTNLTKKTGSKPEPVKLHLMIYGFVQTTKSKILSSSSSATTTAQVAHALTLAGIPKMF